jgi:hypothetical protein
VRGDAKVGHWNEKDRLKGKRRWKEGDEREREGKGQRRTELCGPECLFPAPTVSVAMAFIKISLLPCSTPSAFFRPPSPSRPHRRALESRTSLTFNPTLLVRQNVAPLDIPMNDSLIVQINETLQDLQDIKSDEGFGEATELLDDGVERAVLAVLEDDVEMSGVCGVASVLYDVGVCSKGRVSAREREEPKGSESGRLRFLSRSISLCV